MHRQTAVAGLFYPSDADEISKFIEAHQVITKKDKAKAVLLPHAGYIYSGATAVSTLCRIDIPETVILMGPNHTGAGPAVSVYPEGVWHTPMGDVPIDTDLVDKLCENKAFSKDTSAHQSEHSLEVMLPLLRYFRPDVKVVCITVKYISYEDVKFVSEHIAGCSDALFLISTDLNHFEDVDVTAMKDKMALDRLIAMDPEGLYDVVPSQKISMCGVIPACVGLLYAMDRGALESVFVEHTHSGQVNGDNDKVVGYAGLYYK